jgi:hypothetical protein
LRDVTSFSFRPRFRALALSSVGVGGVLGVVSIAVLGGALLPLATGAIGVALGTGYLLSPSWKLRVVIAHVLRRRRRAREEPARARRRCARSVRHRRQGRAVRGDPGARSARSRRDGRLAGC